MDKLFTLYRHLTEEAIAEKEPQECTKALGILNHILNIIDDLESYGQHITDYGTLSKQDIAYLSHSVEEAYREGLRHIAGDDTIAAILAFASSCPYNTEELIPKLKAQEQERLEERVREQEALGDLDDHPF